MRHQAICLILLLGGGLMVSAQQPAAPPAPQPAPQGVTQRALEARLVLLKQQYDQMVANANATGGAIQECQYWLDQMKAAEAAKAAPAQPPQPSIDGSNDKNIPVQPVAAKKK
jgi:hypothetical protein